MSLVRGKVKRRSSLNVEKLKKAVREVLPSVDAVIGYRAHGDPLHAEPCFIKDEKLVEEMILNPLCVTSPPTSPLKRGGWRWS